MAGTKHGYKNELLTLLHSTPVLHLLFWVNLLGTVYGYVWYWKQLTWTAAEKPFILLPFVPDSPTASLFFTLSLLFLLADRHPAWRRRLAPLAAPRALIDALAVITLFKYGVWAVVINFADGWQGGGIDPVQWMLIVSHAGMAVEALVYSRTLTHGKIALLLAAGWTLLNDGLDYGLGIHPWLYPPLLDDVPVIAVFTVFMSAVSIGLAWFLRPRKKRPIRRPAAD